MRISCCLASSRESTITLRGVPSSPPSTRCTKVRPMEPVPPVTRMVLSWNSMGGPPRLFPARRKQVAERLAGGGAVRREVSVIHGDDIGKADLVGEPHQGSVGQIHRPVGVFLHEGGDLGKRPRWDLEH